VSKVGNYYSINPSAPDVYHDQSNCSSGQQIPPANRRSGTNGYPKCKHCRDM
jgi:hypothetical protein